MPDAFTNPLVGTGETVSTKVAIGVNVRVTVRASDMTTVHCVLLVIGVQPVHVPTRKPVIGWLVSVTVVPLAYDSVQSPVPPRPQLRPVAVTKPLVGTGETVSWKVSGATGVNVTVTVRACVIATVHCVLLL